MAEQEQPTTSEPEAAPAKPVDPSVEALASEHAKLMRAYEDQAAKFTALEAKLQQAEAAHRAEVERGQRSRVTAALVGDYISPVAVDAIVSQNWDKIEIERGEMSDADFEAAKAAKLREQLDAAGLRRQGPAGGGNIERGPRSAGAPFDPYTAYKRRKNG